MTHKDIISLLLNIRSLRNKGDELEILINQLVNVYVTGLYETWLSTAYTKESWWSLIFYQVWVDC